MSLEGAIDVPSLNSERVIRNFQHSQPPGIYETCVNIENAKEIIMS